MNKKRGILFLSSILIVSFVFIPGKKTNIYSSGWLKRIQVENFSSLQRTNLIIPIEVPSDTKNYQLSDGSLGENLLPFYLFKSEKTVLYTQISLKPNEEKTIILTNRGTGQGAYLNPSTEPGTEFLFVNYKKAIVVSHEDKNSISFFSSDGVLLNAEKKPIVLEKGKYFVLESSTPKLTRILSEKPISVFCTTLKDFTDLESVEPGDSDTTTLYGNDLFFFTEKHLFIAAYEKTKITLTDSNGLITWSGNLNENKGILQTLKRGAYHLLSDNPVTIQFGYLDDENFSVLYGKPGKVNGFSFGDLMITSLYPNTKVTVLFGNEKLSKSEYQFKQAGISQIVSLIKQFSPKNPEYIFVSISFNNPCLIYTFSNGNNFGGEYIPGKNGLMADKEFSVVTPRVSTEFSKEQKNLIELIGITNNTAVTASGAWNQKLILQEKTTYVYSSKTPLEKISLEGDKLFQVSLIHNYNKKGLFYWIPPLRDSSVQIEMTNQNGEGMIQNSSSNKKGLSFLFNRQRIGDFFINAKTPSMLPFTIFFFSILLLFIFLIILTWLPVMRNNKEKKLESAEEKEIETIKEQLFIEDQKEVHFTFPNLPPPPKVAIGDFFKITEKEISPKNELPKLEIKEPLEIKPLKIEDTPVAPVNNSFLSQIANKKIVLDPGSANRLYIEGKLQELSNTYMVKSSSKKITAEVTESLTKVDLNRQDLSKASVYTDSLNTFEEAGKALSLCKKLKITFYITSYKLPTQIQGTQVIHVADALKDTLKPS